MIALPAAILGLPPVQEVLFDRGPRIELDLTSEIAVLDIRNPMRGLSVSLYGSDINASKESLIASRVAIRNKGKDGIKPNDVASSDPLGFFITGGELIQITKFSASTEHLRKFAQPKRLNNKVTVNTDLIMDSGDRIVFDLLIKKSQETKIRYYAIGKVSNLNKISVVDSRQQLAARPIYEQAIYGPIFVQILRLIFYFVIGFVLFAGIIFTVDSIQSFLKKIKDNKRTDIIRRFISEQNSRNKTADALAASIYNCGGTQLLSSTLNRVELMSVSSVIGRIKTTPVTVLSETIETNFNSISKFLKNNMYVSQKIISTVEDMLNLSNNDKALVQKSYVDSLTSLLEVARMLDPNDRLNPKFDRYVEMAEFLDHRQRDLAISN